MIKLIYLGLFILISAISTLNGQFSNKQCIIINQRTRRYLYESWAGAPAVWELSRFQYEVLAFSGLLDYNSINEDQSGVWILKPVAQSRDTYFLQNLKYGDYLKVYEGNQYYLPFVKSSRRSVLTENKKNDQELNESYMWKFKNDRNAYQIYNVKYNEPLITGSTKPRSKATEIYTLGNADGFNEDWLLKCKQLY